MSHVSASTNDGNKFKLNSLSWDILKQLLTPFCFDVELIAYVAIKSQLLLFTFVFLL